VLPDATNIDGVAGATEAEAGRAMTSVETICSIRLRPSRMGVCAFLSTLSDMTYIRRNATHREMSVIRFASLCSTSSVLLNIFSAEPASITVHWIFWRTDPCCCRRKCKLSSFARRLRTSVSRSLRLCRMMASVRMRSRRGILDALQFGCKQRKSCCKSLNLMRCVSPSQNQISRDFGQNACCFDERDDARDAADDLHAR
jgi:hypothetical protein